VEKQHYRMYVRVNKKILEKYLDEHVWHIFSKENEKGEIIILI